MSTFVENLVATKHGQTSYSLTYDNPITNTEPPLVLIKDEFYPMWEPTDGVKYNYDGEYVINVDGDLNNYGTFAAGTSAITGLSDLTISVWVYMSSDLSPTVEGAILGNYLDNSTRAFNFEIVAGEPRVRWQPTGDGSTVDITATGANMYTSTWKHVVFTRNTSEMNIYVDGLEYNFTTSSVDIGTMPDLLFGRDYRSTLPFPGMITNMAVWSRMLPIAEIVDMYKAGHLASHYDLETEHATGLRNWWQLNNNTDMNDTITATGEDITPGATINYTAVNSMLPIKGYSADINGNSARYGQFTYTTRNTITNSSNMSISLWVNVSTTAGTGVIMGTQQSDPDANTFNIELVLGQPRILWDMIYPATPIDLQSSTVVSTSLWTHLVFTRASGRLEIYINGVLDSSVDQTIPTTIITDSLMFGRDNNITQMDVFRLPERLISKPFRPILSQPFPGMITNMAVWSRVITVDDVRAIYYGGYMASQYDISTLHSTNLDSWWDLTSNNMNDSVGDGAIKATGLVYSSHGTRPEFVVDKKYIVNITGDSTKYGLFDTTVGNKMGIEDFTVSVWVYMSNELADETRGGVIMGNHLDGIDAGFNIEINTGGRPRIYWDHDAPVNLNGTTNIYNSKWTHLAFTRTLTRLEIYIDGELNAYKNASIINIPSMASLRFGRDRRDNIPFNGMIANIGIWDGVLSHGHIRELTVGGRTNLYDTIDQVSVDLMHWWKLDEYVNFDDSIVGGTAIVAVGNIQSEINRVIAVDGVSVTGASLDSNLLSVNTQYHVVAYAKTAANVYTTGKSIEFSTSDLQSYDLAISDRTATTLKLTWKNGDIGSLVIMGEGSYPTADPVNGTVYEGLETVGVTFATLNTISAGTYIVMNSAFELVNLTGMTSTVDYYFKVYSYDSAYNYMVSDTNTNFINTLDVTHNITITNVDTRSFTVSWNNTKSANGSLVVLNAGGTVNFYPKQETVYSSSTRPACQVVKSTTTSSTFTTATNPTISSSDPIIFVVWVKIPSSTTTAQQLLTINTASGDTLLGITSDGYMSHTDTASSVTTYTAYDIYDNAWHQLVFSIVGTTLTMYMDGNGTTDTVLSLDEGTKTITQIFNSFVGQFTNMSIYKLLTISSINDLIAAGFSANNLNQLAFGVPNILYWWKLNSGTSTASEEINFLYTLSDITLALNEWTADEMTGGLDTVINSDTSVSTVNVTGLTPSTTYYIEGFEMDVSNPSTPLYTTNNTMALNNPITGGPTAACVCRGTLVMTPDRGGIAIEMIKKGDVVLDGQLQHRLVKHALKFSSHTEDDIVIFDQGCINATTPSLDLHIKSCHPMTTIPPSKTVDPRHIVFSRDKKVYRSKEYCGMRRARDYAKIYKDNAKTVKRLSTVFYNIILVSTNTNPNSNSNTNTFIANGVIIESLPEVSKYNWCAVATTLS